MEGVLTALSAAQRYFDAWNARDADAILNSLSENGTYEEPITQGPISGASLKGYAETLWAAFPDLNFEIKSVAETESRRVAAEWIMRGTNHGSFQGLPPTGRSIETIGSDFIETDGDRVSSVVGYFDSRSVPHQLGLQIIVQPTEVGPFRFGTSTAVQTGKDAVPGVFSVSQLYAIDNAAVQKVREYSRQIMSEMMSMPGFIGATVATIGQRMVTISAWTDESAPANFMRQGTHAEAMKPFFDGTLVTSGYTSVWSPERVNTYWVRCDACHKMQAAESNGAVCACGADLPAHPSYWRRPDYRTIGGDQ